MAQPSPRTPVLTGSSPAPEARAQTVIRRLRVLYRALQGHSRRIHEECGVSAAQLWALWEVHLEPGQSVKDLSRRLCIHASTASNMLDKLERKGLLARRRAGRDQRVVRLYATSAGEALLDTAPAPAQGELNRALQALPPESLGALEKGLGDLLDSMEIPDEKAALRPIADD
ncbi:MAG: MarR family winged helix-turn-helix transcriptional regulator [Ectothiorhodospira sp.]